MKSIELKLLKQLELSWNNLDTYYIEASLAGEVIYESQWVLIPIKGKSKVLNYLRKKFSTIKKEMKLKSIVVNAVIGYLPSMNMKPCIILSQLISDELTKVTIMIQIKKSHISRIDVCFIPDPEEVIFP